MEEISKYSNKLSLSLSDKAKENLERIAKSRLDRYEKASKYGWDSISRSPSNYTKERISNIKLILLTKDNDQYRIENIGLPTKKGIIRGNIEHVKQFAPWFRHQDTRKSQVYPWQCNERALKETTKILNGLINSGFRVRTMY